MKDHAFVCPTCQQIDLVEKVSTVYVMGLEMRRKKRGVSSKSNDQKVSSEASLNGPASHFDFPALSRRLAPPAGGKEMTRPIHPDLMVLAFSLVLPIFLFGILSSQPGLLLPVLLILAGGYAIYFWQRKRVIARFEYQQSVRQTDARRVQQGIERWMKLYYCARDDGVFEPGTGTLVPADQMMGYLLQP